MIIFNIKCKIHKFLLRSVLENRSCFKRIVVKSLKNTYEGAYVQLS